LGVCYFPALDEMLLCRKGQGAFLNGRPCRVSSKAELRGSVFCCGSHASMEQHRKAAGFCVSPNSRSRQGHGETPTAMRWCDRARRGHADPVVNRWDVSAMQIIVEEAGGKMTISRAMQTRKPKRSARTGLCMPPCWRASRVRLVGVDFGGKRIGIAVGELESGITPPESRFPLPAPLIREPRIVAIVQQNRQMLSCRNSHYQPDKSPRMERVCRLLVEKISELGMYVRTVTKAFTSVKALPIWSRVPAREQKKMVDGRSGPG